MASVLGAPGASDLTETYAMGSSGGENMVLRVVDGSSAFFGVLEALRQDDLMKVLAEPALVTVSGRPARFLSGGEFPILVPQSLGTTSIEFKTFGTELNFVPIVLGNNRIRLEIRPRVSERDFSQGVTTGSITVPGLRTREVETGVEMDAGQTLAIAGLVQTRVEAQNKGLPLVSEVPYLGMLFRRVEEQRNEVELLIMVTPELVEAMDAHEVPQCGPGLRTTCPDDFELFLQGHLEVPNCCPPGCDPGWGGGGSCGTMMPEGGVISEPPGEGVIIEQTQRDVEVRQANVGGTARSHNRYTPSKLPQGATESRAADENVRPVFFGPIGYDVLE
jgi:pilus assembly protein CpaC